MTFALATLIVGIFAAIVGFGSDAAQSAANKQAVEDTNQTNLDIARETNAANAEQAELAYKRSLPVNQLQDMLAAGMSKPAALQKLAGGGSYSMPTLQSAHMEAPQSNIDFGAFAERLANIPANAEQSQMTSQQLQDLKDIAEQRKVELRMREEEHRQRMEHEQNEELRRQYGHDAVKYTDQLRARVDDLAAKYHINYDELDSQQALVDKLHIDNDPLWRNAPAAARDSVMSHVRAQAAENRANREQNNRDADRRDRHQKVLDDLKNSEFSRTLSHKQYEKLTAEIESIWQDVDAKNDSKGARLAENDAREMIAKVQRIAEELNLHVTEDDLKTYLLHKQDNKVRTELRGFWRFVADVLPINTLFEAARILFK